MPWSPLPSALYKSAYQSVGHRLLTLHNWKQFSCLQSSYQDEFVPAEAVHWVDSELLINNLINPLTLTRRRTLPITINRSSDVHKWRCLRSDPNWCNFSLPISHFAVLKVRVQYFGRNGYRTFETNKNRSTLLRPVSRFLVKRGYSQSANNLPNVLPPFLPQNDPKLTTNCPYSRVPTGIPINTP